MTENVKSFLEGFVQGLGNLRLMGAAFFVGVVIGWLLV